MPDVDVSIAARKAAEVRRRDSPAPKPSKEEMLAAFSQRVAEGYMGPECTDEKPPAGRVALLLFLVFLIILGILAVGGYITNIASVVSVGIFVIAIIWPASNLMQQGKRVRTGSGDGAEPDSKGNGDGAEPYC
jgi:hypothetical protein